MIRNILFKVSPIAGYTFFPRSWQFVDATPKKLLLCWGKLVIMPFLQYFRKKWFAAQQVLALSMQIISNRTEPSLMCKPHTKVFPNQMPQLYPWPVLLCIIMKQNHFVLLFWYSRRFSRKAWFKVIIFLSVYSVVTIQVQVLGAHNGSHPSDPIKHNALSSAHSDLALLSISMVRLELS